MAINFLNTIDLNKNSLDNARVQNLAVEPTADTPGQIYFNTISQTLRITEEILPATNPKTYQWVSVSGDITALIEGTDIDITDATGPTPTINHADITRAANSSTSVSPAYGGTFTAVDTITTSATGHVTAVNVKTVTLPASDDTTYDLTSAANSTSTPPGANINLTDSDGNVDTVTLIGTSGEVVVAQSATAGTIVISQPEDVIIGNDLQVDNDASIDGALTVVGQVTVPAATAATSAPNLGQVEQLVAGIGLFKGGYDASTDPGSPVISGAANIALDLGDYFVVTVDGDITFSDTTISVEVGDMIFANAAIAVNTNPASTAYTFVIQDANIAGSGADDASTEKGVAGFDSASFDVSNTGWVQLNSQKNPYGYKQDLNNTAPCTRAEAGGLTTFTIDITQSAVGVTPAWKIFGTSALAANVKAEITQIASPYETVYADVARSGTGTISFSFTGSVASDVYAALLVYV
jgi:hypothetical protein